MAGKYEQQMKIHHKLIATPNKNYTVVEAFDADHEVKEADAEIADLREKCDKLAGAGWVSVEDRLPEKECIALNATPKTFGYGECVVGYVHREGLLYVCENEHEILRGVTHWMPKPDPVQIAREVHDDKS